MKARSIATPKACIVTAILMFYVVVESGCGGGSTGSRPSSHSLSSISISPVNASIGILGTQQFQATATYNDGSTQDVTSSAAWASSNMSSAMVETTGQAKPGFATGVAEGLATITASFSGDKASSNLSVSASTGGGISAIPLMDMTAQNCVNAPTYQGFQGGLYENCSNAVPSDHDADGKTIAAQIHPLDQNGSPSASGKIVVTSIGMSNAWDEFGRFITDTKGNSSVNHMTLSILNGAFAGMTACYWIPAIGPPTCSAHTGNQYDRIRDTVLTPAGVTEAQVQVVWIKEVNGGPQVTGCGAGASPCQPLCDAANSGCTNTDNTTEALRYESQLGEILRAAKIRWPNLKMAFLASRIYGGYAPLTTNPPPVSPEPYAYEYGYSVKWEIQAQTNQIRTGTVDRVAADLNYNNGTVPWIAWGPYLWANGTNPRSDGLVWCDGQAGAPCNGEIDFQSDGTHPNAQGIGKVSNLLMNFFLSSPYSPWF